MITDYASDQRWWFCTAISSVPNPLNINHVPALQDVLSTGSYARSKELRTAFVRGLALRHDLQPSDVALALFHNDLLAKWRFSSAATSRIRRDAALDGYVARNDAASQYGMIPRPIAGHMRTFLREALPEVGEDWVCTGRFGPGKVYERWPRLKRLAKLDGWLNAPAWRWTRGFETPNEHLPWPCDVNDVDANRSTCRLSAVPKDVAKDRLITVEPAYRSFLQQRVRELILVSIHEGPLGGTALDIGWRDVPSIQRRRALRASRGDIAVATVDLSDASDHITWSAVRDVFPSWLVKLLEESRSEWYEDPRTGACGQVHMYAGMGNATTFMVETLFFSAAVYAFGQLTGIKPRSSVFGDDIICSERLLSMFEAMNPFMVMNVKKTFANDDAIRESCGIFAYKGEDVTYPHIRGFRPTWDGTLGMWGFWLQWRANPLFGDFVTTAAKLCGLENWPCEVVGYPSISCDQIPYDALPPQRINGESQELEFRVPTYRRETVRWRPRPGKSSLFGLAVDEERLAYTASACGMIQAGDVRITGDPEQGRSVRVSDVGRIGYAVNPPNAEGEMRKAWRLCVPPGTPKSMHVAIACEMGSLSAEEAVSALGNPVGTPEAGPLR